jgi:Na+/alanine symporter
MPHRELQDDKGNRSSMRLAFAVLVGVELIMIVVWCILAFIEVRKEVSDWTGLSYVLAAIVGIGGLAGISKAIQKRYENTNNQAQES